MQASGSSEDFVEQSPQKTHDRKTKKKDRLRVAQERKERENERERRELEKNNMKKEKGKDNSCWKIWKKQNERLSCCS